MPCGRVSHVADACIMLAVYIIAGHHHPWMSCCHRRQPSQPVALLLHVIHLPLCSICTMSLCDSSPHARTHAICVVLLHSDPQECSTAWTGCSLWTPINRTPACMHLSCMPPCVCHHVARAPCVYRYSMRVIDMCRAITCGPQEPRRARPRGI